MNVTTWQRKDTYVIYLLFTRHEMVYSSYNIFLLDEHTHTLLYSMILQACSPVRHPLFYLLIMNLFKFGFLKDLIIYYYYIYQLTFHVLKYLVFLCIYTIIFYGYLNFFSKTTLFNIDYFFIRLHLYKKYILSTSIISIYVKWYIWFNIWIIIVIIIMLCNNVV